MSENEKPTSPIARQAIDEFIKNNPDWQAKPKDDLTVLFEKFEAKCRAVSEKMAPIASDVITSGVIHSPQGRKDFALQAHSAFLEQFHTYDKDELLFLLAWTHAQLLTASHA